MSDFRSIKPTYLLLAAAAFGCWPVSASAARAPDDRGTPVLALDFDGDPPVAPPATITTQFPAPDFTPGVRGMAWRSDGFSSWVSAPLVLARGGAFTIESWVALESYPSSLELPPSAIKPASFIAQADAKAGFDLFIDTYGRWGFRLSTDAGNTDIGAPDVFPLGTWAHLAVTHDPRDASIKLYLDGRLVASGTTGGAAFRPASGPVGIARSWQDATMDIFRINGLNAAFDSVRVFDHALSAEAIAHDAAGVTLRDAAAALAVPATRFAGDLQRPVVHAMPPANWTNEPHGLIRRGTVWHLFYQRTPNGPYKTQMHWGHMISDDLVGWTNVADALWPTLQTGSFGYDMKGIWSGDVVNGPGGLAFAFYTSVNHSPAFFNPGISLAVSEDPGLLRWKKLGPLIDRQGLRDFRDPYVWFEDGAWRMIVGAALRGKGGGLAYYRCTNLADLKCWKKQPRIAPFEAMDIGSDIWEMPVLEPIGGGKHILLANPIGGAVSKYGDRPTRAVYWIGTWDGSRFSPDVVTPRNLDVLPGHLSPTVERDAAGQLIAIGIVDERRSAAAQKAAGWAHVFSLPRIWRLLPDGETLGQSPAPGLERLRAAGSHIGAGATGCSGQCKVADLGRAAEYRVNFDESDQSRPYGVFLGASPGGEEVTRILFDPARGEIVLDKSRSTSAADGEGPTVFRGAYDETAFGKPRSFHVYVDHSVIDVFINDAAAFSFRIYPARADSTGFGVIADGTSRASVEAWALAPPARAAIGP